MPQKPFAESCEQNKVPILEVLSQYLPDARSVLEISSGTGQHAVYFARHFPDLVWQPSELAAHLPGIQAWLDDEGPDNMAPPLALDVKDTAHWPDGPFDAVFSANAVHIMDWDAVRCLFDGVGHLLAPAGWFILYGPFNYQGRYTSESNARFDAWLKARDPASGIRDVDALAALGEAAGMALYADHAMPANNRTLVWRAGRG